MKIIEKIVLYISGIGLICLAMLLCVAPMLTWHSYYTVMTFSLMAVLATPAYALVIFELKNLAKKQKREERKENLNDKNKQL